MPSGIKVNTQSLVSIVIGGIAFETPADVGSGRRPTPNAEFTLFANRDEAMKNSGPGRDEIHDGVQGVGARTAPGAPRRLPRHR